MTIDSFKSAQHWANLEYTLSRVKIVRRSEDNDTQMSSMRSSGATPGLNDKIQEEEE